LSASNFRSAHDRRHLDECWRSSLWSKATYKYQVLRLREPLNSSAPPNYRKFRDCNTQEAERLTQAVQRLIFRRQLLSESKFLFAAIFVA